MKESTSADPDGRQLPQQVQKQRAHKPVRESFGVEAVVASAALLVQVRGTE